MSQAAATPPLAVCSWSLDPESPEQLADYLSGLAIDRTQLFLGPLLDQPEVWGDAAAVLSEHGISIASGMFGTEGEDYSTLETIKATGGIVPDETWPTNQANIARIAPLVGKLGLKLVTFHAGFLPEEPNDPNHAKLVERISWIAEQFAQQDCTIAFETGQETAETLKSFLDTLSLPNVGINFDPANMILYGKGDPVQAAKTLLPYIQQVHLKDATATQTPGTWGEEVPLGTGDVDWGAFFQVLQDGGYSGGYAIEREAGPSRVQDITTARDLFHQHFGA